ncbi:MFS general substrate transporter [Tricholoma matsutake]|nr:MFS general substrate transporter [Tricholoma matsutake 945]
MRLKGFSWTSRHRKPNPLPWFQLSIILLLQICEPITSQSIYPYINQLISELDVTGGDERKVGYYAGLIESLFFATEAFTVLQWSRLSDQIGRKPVLLIGLLGTSVSMICFGLSRTFWHLVLSRCLCGLLNGNIGVMKSVMGELTDQTNRAEGFALLPMMWSSGATVGPMLGGTLSKPHERFPRYFGGGFWVKYPYFLPSFITSCFVVFASAVALVFFKESIPNHKAHDSTEEEYLLLHVTDKPIPLRRLMTYPVILSISNYMVLAFLNISFYALLPLFFAMPIDLGGLGFSPARIGYIIGSAGAITGLFQALLFAKIVRCLGERFVFLVGMCSYLPAFMALPIMSFYAHRFGVTIVVWIIIATVIALMTLMDMSYACVFMYITASAPSKRSLGAINGLSQTTVSFARAVGPAMSTSLFSLSVEHKILGGYAVYAILFVFSGLALLLAARLPHEMWEEYDH